MARINSIQYSLSSNLNLNTRRACLDNSEMFITSKLDMLYRQAISSMKFYENRRSLRKRVEGNYLDETV